MINPSSHVMLHDLNIKVKRLENDIALLKKATQEQTKAIAILISQQPQSINEIYQDDIKKAIYGGLH